MCSYDQDYGGDCYSLFPCVSGVSLTLIMTIDFRLLILTFYADISTISLPTPVSFSRSAPIPHISPCAVYIFLTNFSLLLSGHLLSLPSFLPQPPTRPGHHKFLANFSLKLFFNET